jgi:hypothetical protein
MSRRRPLRRKTGPDESGRTSIERCSERAPSDIRRPGITTRGINIADISPDLFMDAVLAYQQTAAIKAALELALFSEIGKGSETAEGPARATGAAVVASAYFAITSRPWPS